MEFFDGIRLPWAGWKIVRYIGGGGYGKVYEIERNMAGVQEKAAVKIVSRPQDENELNDYYDNGYDEVSAKKSFESELQSYAQEYQLMKELQGQSNIVSCDDFAIVPNTNGIGGQIFFRMELLTSLQHLLRDRTLSEVEIIKLGKDISRALILCENINIIHRDIKPQNILVSRFGDYKLGDFGVSKVMDHATFATSQGTIGFQAPEVVHMEKYGHRADIYSLGVTMYWLLNNKKMPFVGADEILTPVLKAEAIQRRYSGEKLPAPKNGSAELKKIILKACAYQPEERYTSAEELYKALEGLESSSKAESGKTTNTKARTTVNSSDVSEDDWSETNQTVGAYKASTATSSKATVDDFEAEQTGSADWGETVGTIGVHGRKEKKEDVKVSNPWRQNTAVIGSIPEQEENETIGAKQAYKKNVKKEKKEDVKVSNPWSQNTAVIGSTASEKENKGSKEKKNSDNIDIDAVLEKIEKAQFSILNVIIDIVAVIMGIVLPSLAIIFGGVVGICIGVVVLLLYLLLTDRVGRAWLPSGYDVSEWLKATEKKVPDLRKYIAKYPDFARRLYYEKFPKEVFLRELNLLNPTVAQEIIAARKKL